MPETPSGELEVIEGCKQQSQRPVALAKIAALEGTHVAVFAPGGAEALRLRDGDTLQGDRRAGGSVAAPVKTTQRRVHEAAFAVLALESEPADPRL
jgi:PNKP adenylyltransferase domain, C-terminal region